MERINNWHLPAGPWFQEIRSRNHQLLATFILIWFIRTKLTVLKFYSIYTYACYVDKPFNLNHLKYALFKNGVGDLINAWKLANTPTKNAWGWWLLDKLIWPAPMVGSIVRKLRGNQQNGVTGPEAVQSLMTSKEVVEWLSTVLNRSQQFHELTVGRAWA